MPAEGAMTDARSYQDRVDELARQIIWLSHHPELISAEAHAIAEDIRARADALEREHQRETEVLNMAVRQVPKIWGQWLRSR
jgi:hypothetical protein